MNIALLGHYAHANAGDDLLAAELSRVLSADGDRVTVYSDASGPGVTDGKRDERGWAAADLIVIGGGSILDADFWAFRGSRFEFLLGKRVVFLNVSVSDRQAQNAAFMGRLRGLGATWWVRDAESVRLLAATGIQATLLPDIALAPAAPSSVVAGKGARRVLSVFPNAYLLDAVTGDDAGKCFQAMHSLRVLAAWLDWMTTFGWKVSIWPSQTSTHVDDRIAGALLYGMMRRKDESYWCPSSPSWETLRRVVATSDLVVSTRFHPTVMAFAASVPVIDITHHAKTRALLAEHGLSEHSVEYDRLSHHALIAAAQHAELSPAYVALCARAVQDARRRWDHFDVWLSSERLLHDLRKVLHDV